MTFESGQVWRRKGERRMITHVTPSHGTHVVRYRLLDKRLVTHAYAWITDFTQWAGEATLLRERGTN